MEEVALTKAQMDAVGIRLGSFEARSLSEIVQATGRLEVSAGNEGVVAPLLAGRVVRLAVSEGQHVRVGDVIAWVEDPEIVQLRQQVSEARQEVATARVELQRQEALAARGAGVRKNLDNARSEVQMAELKLEGCTRQLTVFGLSADEQGGTQFPVKSEVSGVVTAITVPVGGFADIQTPIVKVVNNDGIYCMLQVPEKDISHIKSGMAVDMQLTNDPERTFMGKVAQIGPSMDMETRTVPVKVGLSGASGLLIPGMAVSARVSVGGTSSMALPEGAVVSSGGKSYIFVREDEEGDSIHFQKVEVAAGTTELGYTEVTPLIDLPADAQVVVSGAFYLNSMVSDHGEHNH